MPLISFTILALAFLASPLNAQSTSIDASQSAQLSSALSSYESSLLHGPVATSLIAEVAFDIPFGELSSFASNIETLVPFPTTDQYSYATAPPVTDFSTVDWATTLPAALQSDLQSLRSSVVLGEASVVRSVLNITEIPSIAASTAAASSGSEGTSVASGVGNLMMSALTLALLVSAVLIIMI